MFSRKDLIKKEYNKIMDQRLPNILNLMNQDKHSMALQGGAPIEDTLGGSSVNLGGANSSALGMIGIEGCCYDETELLSKMFTNDHKMLGNIPS